MRTIVLDRPGELRLAETPPLRAPSAEHAIVRVLRVGVCGTDIHAWRGEQPFFSYPRVLGHELAVEVMAVSPGVSDLRPGDRCAVEPYLNCGTCTPCRIGRENCCERLRVLGVHVDGGMQELIEVPVRKLHASASLPVEALALVEMLGIGAHAVRRAAAEASDAVLVLGAGPIGLGTASFAVRRGARVVVADVNPARLAFCASQIRAARVLDLSTRDAPEAVREAFGGELPSLVFDATGNAASMHQAFSLIAQAGRLVFVGLVLGDISFRDPDFHRRETTLLASRNALPADFREVLAAMEAGDIDPVPWVSHRTTFAEAVEVFPAWTRPEAGVIKGMIEL